MLEKFRRDLWKERAWLAVIALVSLVGLAFCFFMARISLDGPVIFLIVMFAIFLVGDLVLLIWASGADL